MKRGLVLILVLVMAAGQLTGGTLKRLNLDDALTIGLQVKTDTQVKAEGKGSVKITTAWPITVCLGEVVGLSVENIKLVFKARVRTELQGSAFLEMWACFGEKQYFSRGFDNQVTAKSEWKTIQTPFMLQKGERPDKIILNLVINGTGTVWVDDVFLSSEPLAIKK